MASAKRLSEKWFQRGLWLVALAFAWFLTGLGEAIVSDLRVERVRTVEDFVDRDRYASLKAASETARAARQAAQADLDQARLALQRAQSDTRAAREGLQNAIASKKATESAAGDPEIRRGASGSTTCSPRSAPRSRRCSNSTRRSSTRASRTSGRRAPWPRCSAAPRSRSRPTAGRRNCAVFGYRLALTLPLLAIAGWLFARKRHGPYWPFVWGFILFALVAFSWSSCPTCRATAATCATAWG